MAAYGGFIREENIVVLEGRSILYAVLETELYMVLKVTM